MPPRTPIQRIPEAPKFQPPTPPIELAGMGGVAPLMLASLPPLASGGDLYMRQFYRSNKVPWRRYLPINLE